MKECKKCGVKKVLGDFCKKLQNLDGRDGSCKDCRTLVQKAHYIKNLDPKRDQRYKTKYGISLSVYNNMLEAQGSRCAVCAAHVVENLRGKKKKKNEHFCVDHNHDTGAVRGLLCHRCNKAIGLLGDSSLTCHNAFQYLEIHDGKEF